MGEETISASIEAIGKACGIKRVFTLDPYDLDNTAKILKECLDANEPSLVVSRAPCVLKEKEPVGKKREIDTSICKTCKMCLRLGCPAMEFTGEDIHINDMLCVGCSMCEQVCKFDAVKTCSCEA